MWRERTGDWSGDTGHKREVWTVEQTGDWTVGWTKDCIGGGINGRTEDGTDMGTGTDMVTGTETETETETWTGMGTIRPNTETGTLIEMGTDIYMVTGTKTKTKLWTGDWTDLGEHTDLRSSCRQRNWVAD